MQKMASVDPAYRNLIQFVPENDERRNSNKAGNVSRQTPHSDASGEEIKDFYESLINSKQFGNVHECTVPDASVSSDRGTVIKKISRHKKGKINTNVSSQNPTLGVNSTSFSQQTITREQRQYFQFLKSAQFGNLSDMQNLLKQGLNVNYTDFYGWTAAMCAAREGHTNIVDCLLESGADVNIVNSDGHTAAMLARNAGHLRLAEKLVYSDVSTTQSNDWQKQEEPSKLYCQSCRSEFYPTQASSHETSVVHLLNRTCKHKKHFYYIPETNRGFQMLLKTGWEQEKGLGPKGEGCKYPIKTILKHDRAGLGDEESGKKRAKVTHFDPNDVSAIKNHQYKNVARTVSARKSAQYAAKRLERKQKSLEQKLRIELNGDMY